MATVSEILGIYPQDLLEIDGEDSGGRRWWVVYTKSRQEKAFCHHLRGLRVPHYLPLVKKISYCRGRRFCSQVPLFSGYVFMHGAEDERILSLTTNRVSQILTVTDGARLRYDLNQISRLIASDAPVTVEQRLAPGRRVRIRQGALAGLEGTIVERRGGRRLFVAVDLLQQGASIDLEDFRLEPLD
jgi:transcription antitermination factor NusG